MTSALDWKVVVTVIVAIIAWLVSFFISIKTFKKGDISRQKDKIITLVEKFIDDLIKEFEKSSNTTDDIDNFISYRVSLIEIQINSIEKRTKKDILGHGFITKLRSNPIDIFEASRAEGDKNISSHQVCGDIYDLSTQIVTEIETNYNEWFFYDYFTAVRERFFIKPWNLLLEKYDILLRWILIPTLFYVFGWVSSELARHWNVHPILTTDNRISMHSLDFPQGEIVDNVKFAEGFSTTHGSSIKVYGNFNDTCMIYLFSKNISRKEDFFENHTEAHLIGLGGGGILTKNITVKNSDNIVVYCDGIIKRISSS